ncbi:MAG: methyltransferase domain-containing protein [Chloroflexi bacterium]|nr:methyltransferase domain-containing protein [Chloroflexota bacterium]
MTTHAPRQANQGGGYIMGYGQTTVNLFQQRRADFFAATLLTRLRPGMSVLDCGCGPGSITLDLAEAVAPGQVVGVDIEPSQVALAQADAAQKGVSNVRFQTADVHKLPFDDGDFGAVFACAVLQYLKDPWQALAEMRRVLKPGGVIGLTNISQEGAVFWPPSDWWEAIARVWTESADPNGMWGRTPGYRDTLQKAGFVRCEIAARYENYGSAEDTRFRAELEAQRLEQLPFYQQAVDKGVVNRLTLDTWAAEMRAWGARPDAFLARPWCEAIGWKEG